MLFSDPDDAVDEVYELLSTLIDNCTRNGCVPVVGGDFNAQIGALQPSDDAACVGACGHGCQSARGERFVHWVLMHGLVVLNRQLDENLADDNWTCKRALDGALVQIDFVLSDSRMFVDNVWNFFFFPLTPFCRDRSQVKELFYWSASRHWDCFYTGQSPDVQSPRQSPLTNQGGCGGSRLGCVGSGGSCARRSLRDGGSPSRL